MAADHSTKETQSKYAVDSSSGDEEEGCVYRDSSNGEGIYSHPDEMAESSSGGEYMDEEEKEGEMRLGQGPLRLYEVLGVEEDADPIEIRSAFKKLAEKWHPDRCGSDAKFKEIQQAYAVLNDPQSREYYDLIGEDFLESDPII